MNVRETAIIPSKLSITLKLRIGSICRAVWVLPYIPLAGKNSPITFRYLFFITEVLIPHKSRVRLSAERLKCQLEPRSRSHHVSVHVLEFSWSKGVFRFSRRRFFRKISADTETIKLHTVYTDRNGQRMLSRRKAHSLGKCRPESSSPIRPPQTAFRKMHGVTIQ